MKDLEGDVVSIRDFDRARLERCVDLAHAMEDFRHAPLLEGQVMASLFFEPSTRTRLSFESAMKLLGGKVIGFTDPTVTSFSKGETLKDTIRMVESYADMILVRHPLEGAARYIAELSKVPVINAGDGANQHPTQTCLDLYTIQKIHGSLEGITIGFLGDLKYGRTVHSLALAMSYFGARMIFISSKQLRMPEELFVEVRSRGCECVETDTLAGVLPELDILYATRIQRERFADPLEYEKEKGTFRVDLASLSGAKEGLKIMHPLPRGDEIAQDVDGSGHAFYFEQAANGIPVRQGLLCMLLGVEP